jgi:hypothetical protein
MRGGSSKLVLGSKALYEVCIQIEVVIGSSWSRFGRNRCVTILVTGSDFEPMEFEVHWPVRLGILLIVERNACIWIEKAFKMKKENHCVCFVVFNTALLKVCSHKDASLIEDTVVKSCNLAWIVCGFNCMYLEQSCDKISVKTFQESVWLNICQNSN